MTLDDFARIGVLLDDFIHRREEPDACYAASLGTCERCKGQTRYTAITFCDTCELALLYLLRDHLDKAERPIGPKKVAVNARWHELADDDLSYEDIVRLAKKPEGTHYTIAYHARLDGDQIRQGTLLPGQRVKLAPRMVIDCVYIR